MAGVDHLPHPYHQYRLTRFLLTCPQNKVRVVLVTHNLAERIETHMFHLLLLHGGNGSGGQGGFPPGASVPNPGGDPPGGVSASSFVPSYSKTWSMKPDISLFPNLSQIQGARPKGVSNESFCLSSGNVQARTANCGILQAAFECGGYGDGTGLVQRFKASSMLVTRPVFVYQDMWCRWKHASPKKWSNDWKEQGESRSSCCSSL